MRDFKKEGQTKKKRINEAIQSRKIRLVDENGEQLGIVDLVIGLQKARNKNLDLVEIEGSHSPPVCRIMDYGKFRYKKRKQQKKTETNTIKEVKFRPKIDTHDYDFKIKNAKQFLTSGHKLKVSLVFRGREFQFKEMGLELFKKISNDLEEFGQTQDKMQITGRISSVMLSPVKSKPKEK